MRISLLFSGFGPLSETLPLVRAADRLGLDGVWYAEHLGFHDAVVPAAAALATTERLDVGLVGPALVSRHPGLLAMELASLGEIAPDRVRIQVGVGHPGLIARLGGEVSKPISRVESFVEGLRELLSGDSISGERAGYPFSNYQVVHYGKAPAIDVMAMRPRMLRAAARLGDGVGLSAGASRQYMTQCVQTLEAELSQLDRPRDEYRITAFQLAAVRPDGDAAAAAVAAHLPIFGEEALRILGPEVVEPGGAEGIGSDLDAGRQMGLAATPEELPGVLETFAATGIDELSLELLGSPDEQIAGVEAVARALGGS